MQPLPDAMRYDVLHVLLAEDILTQNDVFTASIQVEQQHLHRVTQVEMINFIGQQLVHG